MILILTVGELRDHLEVNLKSSRNRIFSYPEMERAGNFTFKDVYLMIMGQIDPKELSEGDISFPTVMFTVYGKD